MTRDEKVQAALNTSTSPEILAQLSRDGEPDVRQAVALNTSTPPEVLVQFSKDSYVRWYVSLNPSTPPDVLAQLSRNKATCVRYNVAQNTSTPHEVLLILMVDDEEDVRQKAEETLNKRVQTPSIHDRV